MNDIIKTKNTEIEFSKDSLRINHIKNLLTSTNVCANGLQTILVRTIDAVSDPIILYVLVDKNMDNGTTEFIIRDEENEYEGKIKFISVRNSIKVNLKVKGPKPIWLIEWKLSGLDFEEIIVPALGGQSLTKEMPNETTLSYKYPFWWNSQFVIGRNKSSLFFLNSKDEKTNLKLLRVGKENNQFSITYGYEAAGPVKNNELETEWFIENFNGNWTVPVDLHRTWLENKFNLKNYYEHPNYLAWAENIDFVLEIWGARKNIDGANHTFSQMIERLKEWEKFYKPENTLVYLPGFAEHGVDSHAPDYNPSVQCGGEKEFEKLISAAHEMGYHIMIHTNVIALTFSHRIYDDFKKFQVIDVFGRRQGWAMDMDGDWLTEPYFAYMNPGYEEWGNYMKDVLGNLINKYKLDAVFLDQTLLAFNLNEGPDFIRGMREHIQKLQNAFPNILFSGEGLHEHVVQALPMAQIHGIDSIGEVHGLEGQESWRKAHPVSTYLFGKYTKFVGHLLTKHPSHPMFKLQEESYERLGVIPVLSLYNKNQKIDLPEVHKMIARAKSLSLKKEILNEEN